MGLCINSEPSWDKDTLNQINIHSVEMNAKEMLTSGGRKFLEGVPMTEESTKKEKVKLNCYTIAARSYFGETQWYEERKVKARSVKEAIQKVHKIYSKKGLSYEVF